MIRILRFRQIGLTTSLFVVGCLLCGCNQRTPIRAESVSQRTSQSSSPSKAAFVDRAEKLGVRFVHHYGRSKPLTIVETMGSGSAFVDFDADGLQDIILIQSGEDFRVPLQSRHTQFFRNIGDGNFSDVTFKIGAVLNHYGMGCCAGDYDNDGFVDVFVTNFDGENLLLRNNGDGTFTDATKEAGIAVSHGLWGTSSAFADFDGDGWLDLFVSDYVQYNPKKPFCRYGQIEGGCTPNEYVPQRKLLFMNNRNGTFTERAKTSGADNPHGAGLGVVTSDFDNDGKLDIYLANDGTPNALLHNLGGGHFKDITLTAGVGYGENGSMQAGMGTDAADINGDELFDIIVTNFQHEPNALYRNLGKLRFTDAVFQMGLGQPSLLKLGFGVSFFDFDLDGDEDIYVGNGHVFDNVERFDTSATYRQQDQLFENERRERFADVSRYAGPAFRAANVTRGVAIGDIDNNGIAEVLCNDSAGPARLLVNETTNHKHWIGLHLQGTVCNRSAIGARARLETQRGVQVKEVRSGSSYLSQSDFGLRFGLGDLSDARTVQLKILWPGGGWQEVPVPALDEYITIREKREVTAQAQHKTDAQNLEEAAASLMRAGQFDEAKPHLKTLARLKPNDAQAWVALGDAEAMSGKLEAAQRAYAKSIKVNPREPLGYRGMGELYLRRQQFKKARETFKAGLALSPDNLDLLLSAGNLAIVMNQIPYARSLLERAVRVAPNHAEAHYLLGWAYERDRHLNAALKENLTAIKLNPSYAEAYSRVGLYHIKLQQYEKARPYLDRAIIINPRVSHYYWALGDSYLFDMSVRDRYDKAANLYKTALELDPNNSDALYSMGMALTRRGRKEDLQNAIPFFERLAQLEPANMNPYYQLSVIYRRLGNAQEWQKYLKLFKERSDKGRLSVAEKFRSKAYLDTPEIHVELGNQYLKQGRAELAVKEFRFALERNPDLQAAQNGLRKAMKESNLPQ